MNSILYLLQVNIYLTLFYGFYSLLLQNETFFKLNRIYLVSGGLLSFLIPLIQSEWIRSLFITRQVEQNLSFGMMGSSMFISPEAAPIFTLTTIFLFVYFTGAAILTLRLAYRLMKIRTAFKAPDSKQAFSFFNFIKIDKSIPDHQVILDHELVHVRQWHSADVLFFEIIAIISWFNPVVYLYRNTIKYIHEFMADEVAVRGSENNAEYALLLVGQTFGIPASQLSNSFFNHSLIKRRIIMLHKSRSARTALIKYGLSAPLFAAMMIFSSANIKQEKIENYTDRLIQSSDGVLISPQPDSLSTDVYQTFLTKNSQVKCLEWNSGTKVNVILKTGEKESYELGNPTELKKAQSKYGNIPMAPPPPPPTPMGQNISQSSLDQDNGPLFTSVEVTPEFPGGVKAFYNYLGKNIRYPDKARKEGVNGKVILQFIVEKSGKLSDVKVLKSLGSGLDEEAVRVLEASPNWKPGIQNGKPVRVQYTLPISFNLGNDKSTPNQGSTGNNLNHVKDSSDVDAKIKNQTVLSMDGFKGLVILDGIPSDKNLLNDIDPNTIESMNVLKGESAIKKYGNKGKEGVIEITTKKK